MTTLCITRGLPASGKSTWARDWVLHHKPGMAVRLNRDDMRRMLFRLDYGRPQHESEEIVSRMQQANARDALGRGISVVIDDTNLRAKYAREWANMAAKLNVSFFVKDFDVDVNDCVRRDAKREGAERVGEDVIRDMYKRYRSNMFAEVTANIEAPPLFAQYVPEDDGVDAVMVDIDGTVALMNGRSPYDSSKYSTDLPNERVVEVVRTMWEAGYKVIFLSGRDETYYDDTRKWLETNLGALTVGAPLFMRPAGDVRNDAIVKLELFDRYVRDTYRVVCAFDDRDRVVAAWRSIGLTVMQVAEGNF